MIKLEEVNSISNGFFHDIVAIAVIQLARVHSIHCGKVKGVLHISAQVKVLTPVQSCEHTVTVLSELRRDNGRIVLATLLVILLKQHFLHFYITVVHHQVLSHEVLQRIAVHDLEL